MAAKLSYRGKEFELPSGMTVRDAIRKVGLSPETILATRKGKLLTDDEILQEDDQIKLIAVISGGADARAARIEPHVPDAVGTAIHAIGSYPCHPCTVEP